jgi:hyperosmotically inducible protein
MKITNKYMQQNLAGNVLVMACLVAFLGLAGCEKEGSAEKAGKKIDFAKENAEQKIEVATEKANEKMTEAKKSLSQLAGKAEESIEKSTDASKEALENAGKKLDEAAESAEKSIENTKESVIVKKDTAGEYIDDSVITMNVKAALLNDSRLKASPSNISVTTVNGVVKLSGTVDSEVSIGIAMEVASSQKNVKSVQTDLVVKAIEPSKEND